MCCLLFSLFFLSFDWCASVFVCFCKFFVQKWRRITSTTRRNKWKHWKLHNKLCSFVYAGKLGIAMCLSSPHVLSPSSTMTSCDSRSLRAFFSIPSPVALRFVEKAERRCVWIRFSVYGVFASQNRKYLVKTIKLWQMLRFKDIHLTSTELQKRNCMRFFSLSLSAVSSVGFLYNEYNWRGSRRSEKKVLSIFSSAKRNVMKIFANTQNTHTHTAEKPKVGQVSVWFFLFVHHFWLRFGVYAEAFNTQE